MKGETLSGGSRTTRFGMRGEGREGKVRQMLQSRTSKVATTGGATAVDHPIALRETVSEGERSCPRDSCAASDPWILRATS